jgi:hypothetical protein
MALSPRLQKIGEIAMFCKLTSARIQVPGFGVAEKKSNITDFLRRVD